MPPDLLAELAQIEHIDGVKQANDDELQPIDGLDVYAGNDGTLARALDLGGPAGSSWPATSWATRCAAWSTSPRTGPRSTRRCGTSTTTLFITANPICTKAALNMLGVRVGGLRLPLVEASEDEAAAVRAMLERHGLLEVAAT